MVEVESQNFGSPASLNGATHLTINREAAFDLDSSNSFEGPEKLLEVWFAASADVLPASAAPLGLKAVSVDQWTEMLDLVHCKILSVIHSNDVDAYLLSESSMFVFPHKLVLKTCGTTTLLSGLPSILEIASSAGFPKTSTQAASKAIAQTHRVFYSRKNFLYPDQQRGPHRSWKDEMDALDELFERGSAYVIGKLNGEHWYLYITEPDADSKSNGADDSGITVQENGKAADIPEDETLEILMTDLDESNARQFYFADASRAAQNDLAQKYQAARKLSKGALEADTAHATANGNGAHAVDINVPGSEAAKLHDELAGVLTTEGHALGTVVSDASGLANVYAKDKYPEAQIDAYLFAPCGFSANGVVPAPRPADSAGTAESTTHYFTVHVTPEPHCSFASFETNVPVRQSGRETAELVEQVVAIFRPGRFSVTLFEAKSDKDTPRGKGKDDVVKGYRRVDRIVHDLNGYELVFRYYERDDWKGGKPRLGET